MTAAPDVAVSTNLGGWINRAGVFATAAEPGPRRRQAARWRGTLGPTGQHIELGISEMNLFMWLSQFGLTGELFGEPLVPIGTVYDPFIARGLDALIYALYVKARFILVGTPSGVTLAPEGGAHQSTITPSLGIELPGLRALRAGLRPGGRLDAAGGDPRLPRPRRTGSRRTCGWPRGRSTSRSPRRSRRAWGSMAGASGAGRRLSPARGGRGRLNRCRPAARSSRSSPSDPIVPEAVAAVRTLHREEIAANLIVVTSAERLAAGQHGGRLDAMRHGRRGPTSGHLGTLLPARRAAGADRDRRRRRVARAELPRRRVRRAGRAARRSTRFGQSGTIPDLYAYAGIDADHIVEAALLALELEAH